MYKKFSSSHFKHLKALKNMSSKKKIILISAIVIVLAPPISLMFWSNWHLSLLAFDFNMGILAIIPLIITNFVMARLVIKLL